MSQTLRFGFIGAGGISIGHAKRLVASGEADVVAIAEPSEASVKRFREATGLSPRVFSSHSQMLAEAELDCVLIASPHTLHFEQAVAALRRGLHVLCEKPMVCSTAHAKQLLAEVERSGKIFTISYQRHVDPKFQWIKRYIESGQLGRLHYVAASLCQEWLQGTRGTWRQVPELSGGGQINDSGSHIIDMMTWFAGPVDEVYAFMDNVTAPVDINSAVSFRFQSGALGTLTIIGDAACWQEDWTISGERGTIFYRNGRLLLCPEFRKPVVEVPASELPPGGDIDKAFIDAVKGRAPNPVPPTIGLGVIQLTEAAWRSAAEGRPIRVSELMQAAS